MAPLTSAACSIGARARWPTSVATGAPPSMRGFGSEHAREFLARARQGHREPVEKALARERADVLGQVGVAESGGALGD